jgi:aerobic carbon-monoxide dehydrogenase small subunit
MLAVQAEGHDIHTVESLEGAEGSMHPLQESFMRNHGLQCGFCTAGFLMTALPFCEQGPSMTDEEIRLAISGQLCRCTGYQGIVDAIRGAGVQEGERRDDR